MLFCFEPIARFGRLIALHAGRTNASGCSGQPNLQAEHESVQLGNGRHPCAAINATCELSLCDHGRFRAGLSGYPGRLTRFDCDRSRIRCEMPAKSRPIPFEPGENHGKEAVPLVRDVLCRW